MIAKIIDNTGELNLEDLTYEGLQEARFQADELINSISQEIELNQYSYN